MMIVPSPPIAYPRGDIDKRGQRFVVPKMASDFLRNAGRKE